ncbi:MAG: AMP-dependent synthetase [Alphaproteobacteria bacterium]|nr:AMP-dependent synthetase [Alphaproteobacteria bacterium]
MLAYAELAFSQEFGDRNRIVMLPSGNTYEEVYKKFRWEIPERYNIAREVCDRHDTGRLALIFDDDRGNVQRFTFGDIRKLSSKLANVLKAHGVTRGDRVAVLMAQSPEVAISHVAAYRIGAVGVPLFALFGADAIEFRLGNAGAKAVILDAVHLPKLEQVREQLPELKTVIVIGAGKHGAWFKDYETLMAEASDFSPVVDTAAEDPAFLIYTSGTTGQPKGALHVHRALIGHIPAVQQWLDGYPKGNELYWTPADWAWIAGLYDVLFPAWYLGMPVLAQRAPKFDAEKAFALIARHNVGVTFIPPTALKMMRQVEKPREKWKYNVRSLATGGEAMGAELMAWGRETFGLTLSEGYGQTECNLMTTNSPSLYKPRPGSAGRASVGRKVAIVDNDGNVLPPGVEGNIAALRPDPVMMKEYWRNPEATKKKFAGDWLLTGDVGSMDPDGYVWFKSRDDDVITSGGYRIGPGEIEESLLKHPAVGLAAAVGIPDPVRTEIVKAFIQLKPDVKPSDALKKEIQEFIKTQLAAHEYPREVEFVSEFPLTTTGKIMRRELKRMDMEKRAKKAG